MRHPIRILLLFVALCLLLTACGTTSIAPTPTPTTLNVFAAASLTESFNEIGKNFEAAHPGVIVKFNYNGSQLLEQQIANGAAADVFASADQTNMQKASGLVNTPQVFVKNKLVVIVPSTNPAGITTLKDLAKQGVKIDIEAATVPAGKYSRQVLDTLAKSADYGPDYVKAVVANFVSQEDNVKSVVQKVQLGEVDAGIVYRTDVTNAVASKVTVIDIPDQFNVIAQYPIVTTKSSTHASDAQTFVQYVLSVAGQAVLQKYHFITVNGS